MKSASKRRPVLVRLRWARMILDHCYAHVVAARRGYVAKVWLILGDNGLKSRYGWSVKSPTGAIQTGESKSERSAKTEARNKMVAATPVAAPREQLKMFGT